MTLVEFLYSQYLELNSILTFAAKTNIIYRKNMSSKILSTYLQYWLRYSENVIFSVMLTF